MTFSTNSRAASFASAAGKYTLIVTQALNNNAPATGMPNHCFMTLLLCASFDDPSFHDRRHFALADRDQPLDQGGPIHVAIETDHVEPRQAGTFNDSKGVPALTAM